MLEEWNKETAAMLEEWNTLLGIELLDYSNENSSFCFSTYMLQVILFLRLICNQTRSFCFNLGHFILN